MNIKFVYATIRLVKAKKYIPAGYGHIFVDKEETSLCGKSHSEIGAKFVIRQNRVESLLVCAECAEAWKRHPESQWMKFVGAQA